MKGLLVLLVCFGIAHAAAPATLEKGIIDDIIAVTKCLEGLFNDTKDLIEGVIATVTDFQNIINNAVNDLKSCTELGDPVSIANCIMDVSNQIQADVVNGINTIQQAISGLISLPNDIIDCINILG